MKWDESFFNQYMDELQEHLFRDMNISEIIELEKRSHRARRLLNLHILRNREVFHEFYKMRKELGIQSVFDQVISTLYHDIEKKPIKQDIINLLGIEKSMISSHIEGYYIKEFDKDISAFRMHWRKKKGDLAHLRQNREGQDN